MNRFIPALLLCFVAPFAGLGASAHPDETETFIEADVPFAPIFAHGSDGKTYLLYELHMTYLPVFQTDEPATIKRIEVISGRKNGKLLKTFEGESLRQLTHRLGEKETPKGDPQIAPGTKTMFFAFLPFEATEKVPLYLVHQITVDIPGSSNSTRSVACAATNVGSSSPDIGPPMRGDGWFAVNGPGPSSPHRNAAIPYRGQTHVAQRFAIDWVQIDERGETRRPDSDPKKCESYYCFGKEAIAVADGTVVALRDGRPNNTPVGEIAKEANLVDGLAGNFAVIDLGDNKFAVYCHLQPGTFRVKKGENVKRGQPIALIGNSGNSSEPHLHFHVADHPVIFDGEGVPYQIDSFEVQMAGKDATKIMDEHEKGKPVHVPLPVPGKPVHNAIPMENDVVRFP